MFDSIKFDEREISFGMSTLLLDAAEMNAEKKVIDPGRGTVRPVILIVAMIKAIASRIV